MEKECGNCGYRKDGWNNCPNGRPYCEEGNRHKWKPKEPKLKFKKGKI